MRLNGFTAALVSSVCIVALATPANAQQRQFNIAAGSLKSALDAYARQSGRPVIYKADDVRRARSGGAQGILTNDAALSTLLKSTGFSFRTDSSGAIAIIPGTDRASSAGADNQSADIVVTGSHIRGAPVAAQVITQTQKEMRNAGFTNLGDVARSLPQSFGGGQNPQIALGTPGENANTNSASSLNLRGLGPDATLTLLNGHRLAYDAPNQAIDISAIPLAAVDRIEIVADGASALYGSDAVGGVANIILKRDYDGLYTSARVGAATEGGNVQQQYNVVAGTKWSSGGVIATYDFERNTAIRAAQRSFTDTLNPDYVIYPSQKHHSAILAGHQKLADNVTFSFDGFYSHRFSSTTTPRTVTGSYLVNGDDRRPTVTSYAIAPKFEVTLSTLWRATVFGLYARDDTEIYNARYVNGALATLNTGHYLNDTKSLEALVDGALIELPGGAAKIAIGGGFRASNLDSLISARTGAVTSLTRNFDNGRESYFGYAEIFIPIFSARNRLPGLHNLSVSSAVRYENYGGKNKLATPKFGLIYAPAEDIEVKTSWGKSFKVPTLSQQYVPSGGYIENALAYGGSSGQIMLSADGGRPDLTSERATTLSVTTALSPRFVPGLRVEVSYFDIRYKDRIIRPIASWGGVLRNPSYSAQILRNPTPAQLTAIMAELTGGVGNYTGGPYDLQSIIAYVDGRYANVAEQRIKGLDFQATYDLDAGENGHVTLSAGGSYLDSKQRRNVTQPWENLAGVIFNPPHFRMRGGAVWEIGTTTLSAFGSHNGGVKDNRGGIRTSVKGMTTLDFTVRHTIESGPRIVQGLEISLSLLNALNAKPDTIRAISSTSPLYDSTNYSPIGRFAGLTLGKKW